MSLWRLLAAAIACAGASMAPASADEAVTLAPSPAVRCLTPAPEHRGAPEYPLDAWKMGRKGRVVVELAFSVSDARPEVKVLAQEGGDGFVDSVMDHVRSFRLPCLAAADAPARLRQEYVFKPDERKVYWAQPVDAADAGRAAMLRCLRHVSGDRGPSYPVEARRNETQGRVLLSMKFTAPDQPPEFQVYSRSEARTLARAVEGWASGYRMPCHHGGPLEATRIFVFRLEGDPAFGFKDASLPQLLPAIKGVRQQRLQIDSTVMGCPFDLRLTYRQPHMPNAVGEIGSHDPARRPLLDWLAKADLDLRPKTLDAVFADSLTLHVPCIKIDLNPQE